MNLEQQVTSLEISKRLKELGVKQESLFSWCVGKEFWKDENIEFNIKYDLYLNTKPLAWRLHEKLHNHEIDSLSRGGCGCCEDTSDTKNSHSAYTVAELGEMLPYGYPSSRDETGWYMTCINPIAKWREMYPAKTEADARGKMLIHLIENKLIELQNDLSQQPLS